MLFTFKPPSPILSAISPCINPKSFLHVAHKLARISDSISILIETKTMHLVLLPLATELLAIRPDLLAIALYFAVHPLPLIVCSIYVSVFTKPIFVAHCVLSLVLCSPNECFNTFAMLMIVSPVPFESRTI